MSSHLLQGFQSIACGHGVANPLEQGRHDCSSDDAAGQQQLRQTGQHVQPPQRRGQCRQDHCNAAVIGMERYASFNDMHPVSFRTWFGVVCATRRPARIGAVLGFIQGMAGNPQFGSHIYLPDGIGEEYYLV
ncbi:hypothetical protein DL240490_04090 [Mycobacterium marinum]|nr:hypothetical protein DL240490_04090 [Mycobacterium marinum]